MIPTLLMEPKPSKPRAIFVVGSGYAAHETLRIAGFWAYQESRSYDLPISELGILTHPLEHHDNVPSRKHCSDSFREGKGPTRGP